MINQTLFDLAVQHLADTKLFVEGVDQSNQRIAIQHAKRLKELIIRGQADLQVENSRFFTEVFVNTQSRMSDLSAAAVSFNTGLLHKTVGKFYRVDRPDFDMSIAVFKRSLRNEIEALAPRHLDEILSVIRDNPKLTHEQMAELAVQKVDLTANRVRTITRTTATQVENSAALRVMRANADVVAGYRFTAILDARTSITCRSHDGQIFEISDMQFMPPLHWNCRSFAVPMIRHAKDISGPRVTGRVPDTGEPPGKELYTEWLRRQSADVQKRMLGGSEEALALFQNGKLAVSEFTTKTGRYVSLERLRKLDMQRVETITSDLRELPSVTKPSGLIGSPAQQDLLIKMLIDDAESANQSLGLMDYKGTTLSGKRASRLRTLNPTDERNFSINPWSGEVKNTLVYDPDFGVLRERLDALKGDRALPKSHRDFIVEFVGKLDDKVSVNQQTAVLDNLRVLFTRYAKKGEEWRDFATVVRAEMKYSVMNTSSVIDNRSRKSSEVFGLRDSVVRIGGEKFTFEQLKDDYYRDARLIKEWRPGWIAAKLDATGKLPTSRYVRFELELPKKPSLFKPKAEPKVDTRPNVLERARGYLEKLNQLDLELKSAAIPKYDSPTADILRLVADGRSTDYDSLAIKIGERVYKEWKPHHWFRPTIEERHAAGSEVLETLRKQKVIAVSKRGVTRRAVIDIETGRPNGEWKNTVSREVTVLDPEMKAHQLRMRKVMLTQRLGLIEMHAKAGTTDLFDKLGNRTGVSAITRNASIDYDPKLIDADFERMLNHTMSVKYVVDKEFASFMDEVAVFKDDRGRAAEFDELNKWRQLILQRGDQGFGLLQTIRYHYNSGVPFSVPAQIDGRGRVYYVGYLSPTGGEVARPFIGSANVGDFGVAELRELMLQTGALIGPATNALTQSGRMAIFKEHEADVLSLGRLLLTNTQRQQKIRDYLMHPLIKEMDAEEVPKITRLALEYARVHAHTGGDFRLLQSRPMKTHLMIENDASSSGAQIIGLSTRDRDISVNSNVLPTMQKNRLYDLVAMDTAADPRLREIPALRHVNITWEDLQKAAKSANMVAFYGAGEATQAANIEAKFAGVLAKKGLTVITKAEAQSLLKQIDKVAKDAEYAGADDVVLAMHSMRNEVKDVLAGDEPIGRQLLTELKNLGPEAEAVANKLTDSMAMRPKDFDAVAKLMSEHLGARAPVTKNFVKFWNQAAKLYTMESGSTDIPWVTFDGKELIQRYRVKTQTSIEFWDDRAGRMVRNIYEERAKDGALQGKSSITNARIGLGVNGNHMNDASIVRRFHLWGADNGVDTATIHDAFFTNIADTDAAKVALRNIYADAVESETIRNTLRAMRKRGMSEATYRKLLADAKELGLVDPPNPVTRADVLKPIPPGYDWYGIGP